MFRKKKSIKRSQLLEVRRLKNFFTIFLIYEIIIFLNKLYYQIYFFYK